VLLVVVPIVVAAFMPTFASALLVILGTLWELPSPTS